MNIFYERDYNTPWKEKTSRVIDLDIIRGVIVTKAIIGKNSPTVQDGGDNNNFPEISFQGLQLVFDKDRTDITVVSVRVIWRDDQQRLIGKIRIGYRPRSRKRICRIHANSHRGNIQLP